MTNLSLPGVVLHVDDDDEQRHSLALVLRLAGFRQHEANTARSAIQASKALHDELDVLIVDYRLGQEETGTDVAESVARVLGHCVPTVILTGDLANAEIPLLTNAPVWMVRKPADPEVLITALPSLVAFRRAVRALELTRLSLR